MALAGMVATDEDALTCDLWEVYGVTDWRALPPHTAAMLAFGLPRDSRIMMKLTGAKYTTRELLLATIADSVRAIVYGMSKDKGERPKSIVEAMTGTEKPADFEAYDSPEAFMAARARILGEIDGNNS